MDNIKVLNPFNQEVIKELEYTSEEFVMNSLEKAKEAFDSRNLHTKIERLDILRKFKRLVEENKDQLIEQALLEGGKPYKDSLAEIERGINGIDLAIEGLSNLTGHQVPMNLNGASVNKMAFTNYDVFQLLIIYIKLV